MTARWSLTIQADTIANLRDALRRASEAMATAAQPVMAAAYETVASGVSAPWSGVDRPDTAMFEISKVHANVIRRDALSRAAMWFESHGHYHESYQGATVAVMLRKYRDSEFMDVGNTNTARLGKAPE